MGKQRPNTPRRQRELAVNSCWTNVYRGTNYILLMMMLTPSDINIIIIVVVIVSIMVAGSKSHFDLVGLWRGRDEVKVEERRRRVFVSRSETLFQLSRQRPAHPQTDNHVTTSRARGRSMPNYVPNSDSFRKLLKTHFSLAFGVH